ncbi:MAG: Gfo/Idh/MocA family oxidoreductase [Chloroflexi bacterium]|nr:Gfo/Idh/MocA family oxidoreductase [Chloroflexota bacterium]
MKYNYEYDRKLQVAYIGGGEHSFRNILPSLQYAPIDLVALTDHKGDRGLAVARQFGARRFYPNHRALLAKETSLDAVMISVGPDEEGRPRYPELAAEALGAGFHVWIDEPPCLSAEDISTFTNACIRKHRYLAVGFVRQCAPAYLQAASLIKDKAFGQPTSYAFRFPMALPELTRRRTDKGASAMLPITGVVALLADLFGEIKGFSMVRGTAGAAVLSLQHANGTPGSLHLTAGQSLSAPRERLEIIGRRASLVVDGGVRVTYYRRVAPVAEELAGRQDTSFTGDVDSAPVVWAPQLNLEEPAAQHIALSGYLGSIQSFAEQLLAGQPPKHGTLVDALHVMTVFDRLRAGREQEWLEV